MDRKGQKGDDAIKRAEERARSLRDDQTPVFGHGSQAQQEVRFSDVKNESKQPGKHSSRDSCEERTV